MEFFETSQSRALYLHWINKQSYLSFGLYTHVETVIVDDERRTGDYELPAAWLGDGVALVLGGQSARVGSHHDRLSGYPG